MCACERERMNPRVNPPRPQNRNVNACYSGAALLTIIISLRLLSSLVSALFIDGAAPDGEKLPSVVGED